MHRLLAAFYLVALLSGGQALAINDKVHGAWTSGERQDIHYYYSVNLKGDRFAINCGAGGIESGAAFVVATIAGREPEPSSTVTMIINGGLTVSLTADEDGHVASDTQITQDEFRTLWSGLRRGSRLTVSLAKGRSGDFSLKGARQALPEQPCGGS